MYLPVDDDGGDGGDVENVGRRTNPGIVTAKLRRIIEDLTLFLLNDAGVGRHTSVLILLGIITTATTTISNEEKKLRKEKRGCNMLRSAR